MLYRRLQLQNQNLHSNLLENLTVPLSSSSRVSAVLFRDSSGRFLPQSDSQQGAHEGSEN